jgi:sterol desaturase/sphingolipid hydroxylase (fatty acid hydroxylase superfamily)
MGFGLLDDIFNYAFTNLAARLHWSVFLSVALLSLLSWRYVRRHSPRWKDKGFFGFLFAREVWLHRSAKLDYRFVLFDKVALALLIGLVGAMLVPGGEQALEDLGEDIVADALAADFEVLLGYTFALLLLDDLCRYWTHRWMHTSEFLWQFHKVHHSPEVLVPISQMRHHPVNGLINLARNVLVTTLVTGVFVLVFPGDLTVVTVAGVNVGRMVFYVTGGNLRHSHVWFSFGPVLERILVSPAQHQIHHSKAPEHIDRNFGSQFAIWDWMFGTLYVPKGYEELELGIDRDSTERMRSIKGLYVEPVKDAIKVLKRRRDDAKVSAMD